MFIEWHCIKRLSFSTLCSFFIILRCDSDFWTVFCSIVSDHDAIHACVNVRLPRFQPRYKFIRDIRNFKEDVFKEDFSTLPLSVISYSDDPDEQLETLNTLISECLERHAPCWRFVSRDHPLHGWRTHWQRNFRRNEMLLDLPLTRPALMLLGMSFVRSGRN